MAITLGNLTFDEAHTTVREKFEEVGGRDARHIEITGVVVGLHSVADIEAQLDAILDAASDPVEAALSLRSGRRLIVQRTRFSRDISKDTLVGSFVLGLDARNPFEESTTVRTVSWSIAASGSTKQVSGGGNVFSTPTISMVAAGNVVNPSFSDGVRSLTYLGTVGNGKTLVLDGTAGTVRLEGQDVTAYTTGLFPRIAAEGSTLVYTDHASSSHTASATIQIRDRWW